MALTDKMRAIADAIRAKTGSTRALTLDEMSLKISAIVDKWNQIVDRSVEELTEEDFIGVSDIGDTAFYYATHLKKVKFASHIDRIGRLAFSSCSLEELDFSACTKVVELKDIYVFANAPSTCKVIIPDDLYDEWIAAKIWKTFYDNGAFIFVRANRSEYFIDPEKEFTDKLRAIADVVRTKTNSVDSMTLDEIAARISEIPINAKQRQIIDRSVLELVENDFEGVSCISSYAFSYCGQLSSVSIHSDVGYLATRAFSDCPSLKTVKLNSAKFFYQGAFSNCTSLEQVDMGYNPYQVKASTFAGCTSLKKLDFSKCTSIIPTDASAFTNVPSTCKIIIPDDLYDEWIAAEYWRDYYNNKMLTFVKASTPDAAVYLTQTVYDIFCNNLIPCTIDVTDAVATGNGKYPYRIPMTEPYDFAIDECTHDLKIVSNNGNDVHHTKGFTQCGIYFTHAAYELAKTSECSLSLSNPEDVYPTHNSQYPYLVEIPVGREFSIGSWSSTQFYIVADTNDGRQEWVTKQLSGEDPLGKMTTVTGITGNVVVMVAAEENRSQYVDPKEVYVAVDLTNLTGNTCVLGADEEYIDPLWDKHKHKLRLWVKGIGAKDEEMIIDDILSVYPIGLPQPDEAEPDRIKLASQVSASDFVKNGEFYVATMPSSIMDAGYFHIRGGSEDDVISVTGATEYGRLKNSSYGYGLYWNVVIGDTDIYITFY